MRTAITNFKLDTLLGKGAFGDVWLSELRNQKKVAIKFMTAASELNQLEFKQEVQMLSKLCHPNIGKILVAASISPLHLTSAAACCLDFR